MSVPYNPAVANLSLSDPNCINAGDECTAYYAAQNQSQADISWAYQFEYGHWATYYYVIIIGVIFLANVYRIIRNHLNRTLRAATLRKSSVFRKLQALLRYVFYRHIRTTWPARVLDIPSDLGTLVFLLITIIFLTALVFAVKPYYREQIGYGSPPIAIRTGLMAFACVPILVALAGKANVVTFFTGISYERLNGLHRWVSWISFALSLFHSLPFLVGSAQNPIVGGEFQVKNQFYMYGRSGANEYTGVPPLAILFALCVLSLPYIREKFYESFYAAHILLGITYVGLLFWHAANTLDSWAYLWATIAIWATSWLVRVFGKTRTLSVHRTWFTADTATVSLMPGDVTRVDVWPSDEFHWKPSQHVFLRFADIAPLDNHPFTIATSEVAHGSPAHLVFLTRTHSGFTRKIASYAEARESTDDKAATTSVCIEGPYGICHQPLSGRYSSLILLAGGTGITACFPWLQHVIFSACGQSSDVAIKRVVLLWAMKRPRAMQWLADEWKSLGEVKKTASNVELEIRVHITGDDTISGDSTPVDLPQERAAGDEKEDKSEIQTTSVDTDPRPSSPLSSLRAFGATVHAGRPIMATVLQKFVRQGESTMVIGCGPHTFRADLANAVAAAQSRVFRGEVVELAMHLEKFGW